MTTGEGCLFKDDTCHTEFLQVLPLKRTDWLNKGYDRAGSVSGCLFGFLVSLPKLSKGHFLVYTNPLTIRVANLRDLLNGSVAHQRWTNASENGRIPSEAAAVDYTTAIFRSGVSAKTLRGQTASLPH